MTRSESGNASPSPFQNAFLGIRTGVQKFFTAEQPQTGRIPYRHEWKYPLTIPALMELRYRVRHVARQDPYAAKIGGQYRIRSLYFDDLQDSAFFEKLDGEDPREKFRLRYYNGDTSLIRLEKKCRRNGLGVKYSEKLNEREVKDLLEHRLDWMQKELEKKYQDQEARKLTLELYCQMRMRRLRPKTIVEYTREPYVYPPGNVRITFDFNLRTGICSTDFLNPECTLVPAGTAPVLMEVKWDRFLPSVIQDAIQMPGLYAAAFSKYAQCRVYG